jgi:hypothetical protein
LKENGIAHEHVGKVTALVLVALLAVMIPNGLVSTGLTDDAGTIVRTRGPGPVRSSNISSITGEHMVSQVAYMRFIGDGTPVSSGGLGSFIGSADIDGDGNLELAMSAPGITSGGGDVDAGILYVMNGTADLSAVDVDLQEQLLDLTIRSKSPYSSLLSSFASGDLNGDGHTDLILGAPSWPDTGKVCVLWGGPGGFPPDLDLVRIIGSTPNGNPVGFLRTESYAVIAGLVTTSVLGTMLGKNVMAGDLDSDGVDDLVFTFHGWNAVFIVWGSTDKMQFGSDLTYIKNSMQTSQFGHGCLLDDIDGNGALDLAITSPTADDDNRGLLQVGAVHVVFGAGRLRGNTSLQIEDIARPTIYGRDPYDQFGLDLRSKDLNHDLMADLIIGAPGDDGPNNDRYEAGQLMVFYGADVVNFPTNMVGIDRCDKVIYGAQGRIGKIEPDALGSQFAIGDLDGDGDHELMVGTPGKDGDSSENAGNCIIFSNADSFGVTGVTADLSKAVPVAVLKGDDPYDGLGFQVEAMDLNDDSIDDLVVSSPGGDGPGNDRPGAGEVYLLLGSSLVIDSIGLTGEAVTDGTLYTGAGNATLEVRFRQYPQAIGATPAKVVVDPDGLGIVLVLGPGGAEKEGDAYDLVTYDEDRSSITANGVSGTLRLALSFGWFYYMTQEAAVIVSFGVGGDIWVERTFISPFHAERDIRLKDEPTILRNGASMPTGHEWFSSGDSLSMKGLTLIYSDGSGRTFDGSRATASLLRDGTMVGQGRADGKWTIEDAVPAQGSVAYSVVIGHHQDEVPAGFPEGLRPGTGMPFKIDIKVDDTDPDPPGNVIIGPDPGRLSMYDDDTQWELSWDALLDDSSDPFTEGTLRRMDHNGSGIRGFNAQVNDGPPLIARADGGLQATYFRDGNFTEHGMMRVDSSIHFTEDDWGMWGPGPERVPPYGFSVRWDGWVRFPKDRYYRFELTGMGTAKLIMDGAIVIDWTNLSTSPITAARYYTKDEMRSVEIYLRQDGPGSSISFLVDDDRGEFVPVPEGELYHVSNKVSLNIPGAGVQTVALTSIDWAGRTSRTKELELVMERDVPGFNLTEYRSWYAEASPTVELIIYDPASYGGFGSGVNTTSLEYRLRKGSDTAFGEWSGKGRKVTALVQGPELPASVRTSFKLELTNDWNGQVQFRARDGAGNEIQSSSLFLGVDMVPPSISLIAPNLSKPQMSTGFDVLIRTFDGKGSGVDGGSIGYRLRNTASTEWGEWTLMGQKDTGLEVLTTMTLRLSPGDYVLQFQAQDSVGNLGLSPMYDLQVEEPRTDLAPVPVIKAPLDGAIYRIGYPVPLDATGTTDDGLGRYPSLVLTWFSNVSGYLGSGRSLTTYKLTPGHHRITLFADDGSPGHNVTAVVNITIKDMDVLDDDDVDPIDDDGDIDLLVLLGAFTVITILIAALVIFLMMRYRARREEEIRLEYAVRTEDDDYYDDRTMEEERALGINVEEKKLSGEELERKRRELYGED